MIDFEHFNSYYLLIYSFFALISVLISLQIDVKGYNIITAKFCDFYAIILLSSFILLVGLRAHDVGTDTETYYMNWQSLTSFENSSDVLFYYIMYIFKKVGFTYQTFLLSISFIFFFTIYLSIRKIANSDKIKLYFIFFSFVSFFFFITLSINIIRQGVALAFLLLAYSFCIDSSNKGRIIIALSLSLVALGFHFTSLIPLLLFTFVLLFHRVDLKYYYILYIIIMLMSIKGIGINNIAPFLSDILAGDKRSAYIGQTSSSTYVVGFKPQFAAFNTIFLLFSYYINYLYKNKTYETLLKYYIIASCLFFMAFQIPFSDRWGLFSWIIIPLLLSPIFSSDNNDIKIYKTPIVLFIIFIFFFFYGYK